jgi:hypothetical protein
MKSILALTAVAFLCSTSGAFAARSKTTDISLDNFCNTFSVTISGLVAVAKDKPSCTGTYGGGLVATVKDTGKTVLLALQDQTGSPGVQTMLELSYPFTDGGTYKIYQTTDGTSFIDEFDGAYSIGTDALIGPKSDHSVTALFRH